MQLKRKSASNYIRDSIKYIRASFEDWKKDLLSLNQNMNIEKNRDLLT